MMQLASLLLAVAGLIASSLAGAQDTPSASMQNDCPAPLATYDASRIAVAGGSITEAIYLLGESQRLVAADRTSNYPQAALALPSIGYVRALSAEGVLSVAPTLVLGEHDMGPPEVVAQLRRTLVPVVAFPERFTAAGVLAKVRCVAQLLGQSVDQRAAAVAPLRAAARSLELVVPDPTVKVAVLLGLREGAPIAAGRDTSGDGLLAMAGLSNLFSGFAGWKPVSMEAMAQAAPDVLVVPQRGLEQAGGIDALLDHPALRLTPAAQRRQVIAMDGMRMLGFGPRTIGAAAELAQRVGTLDPPEPAP